MSVFNTDNITIVNKEGDWFLSASVESKALSTFLFQITLVIQKKCFPL